MTIKKCKVISMYHVVWHIIHNNAHRKTIGDKKCSSRREQQAHSKDRVLFVNKVWMNHKELKLPLSELNWNEKKCYNDALADCWLFSFVAGKKYMEKWRWGQRFLLIVVSSCFEVMKSRWSEMNRAVNELGEDKCDVQINFFQSGFVGIISKTI